MLKRVKVDSMRAQIMEDAGWKREGIIRNGFVNMRAPADYDPETGERTIS